jgi:hypothetical protein
LSALSEPTWRTVPAAWPTNVDVDSQDDFTLSKSWHCNHPMVAAYDPEMAVVPTRPDRHPAATFNPKTLRSRERDGLITRTATPTVPVSVSYELTDLGLSLHQMMRGLKTWAEMHRDDVLANPRRAAPEPRTEGAT